MSGHSHWARIKHKKGTADARRGKLFSKLVRVVISAAREGGGKPEMNLKLQYAIEKAREANIPRDTIDRAIKKGTGELEGAAYEEVLFEGYGPGGVAILIQTLTDNRNRTTGELRRLFERNGGSMAGANAVAWMFERKGVLTVERNAVPEDEMLTLALDSGAEDVRTEEDVYEITCAMQDFAKVKGALAARLKVSSADLSYLPKSRVDVDDGAGRKLLGLLDQFEDNEDVQNVYANYDLPETLLKAMEAAP